MSVESNGLAVPIRVPLEAENRPERLPAALFPYRGKLCITADDYGETEWTNWTVERLADTGAIDAVSVMVHQGALLSSISRLRASGLPTGLHLVFTRERALTRALGQLPGGWRRLSARLLVEPGLVRKLVVEAEAQIERFLSLGLPLDFINGHQHAHLLPPLWPALAELIEKVAPQAAVRVAIGQLPSWSAQGLVTLSSELCWRRRPLPGCAVLSPLGVSDSGRLTLRSVARELRAAQAMRGVCPELVVHPAREYALLASPAIKKLLERHG